MRQATETQRILRLIRKSGTIRAKDLAPLGLSRQSLLRLYEAGILERPSRGLYVMANAQVGENHSLAEAAKLVPAGIVCLLSALQFHRLTTQSPFEVWLAISNKAWKPDVSSPALRIIRFSGQSLAYGVQQHKIEGITVKIYSPAKTVADCFKSRNTVGIDVAIEALRDCWRKKKATMDQLWEAAKVCRMANVMRPYMESLE